MNNAATIPFTHLIAFYGLLIIPFAMLWQLKLGDTLRKFSVSLVRMTLQLGLIALYLEFLFRFNHLWINVGWLLVMLIVASSLIVKQAGLSRATPVFRFIHRPVSRLVYCAGGDASAGETHPLV